MLGHFTPRVEAVGHACPAKSNLLARPSFTPSIFVTGGEREREREIEKEREIGRERER